MKQETVVVRSLEEVLECGRYALHEYEVKLQ